MRKLRGEIKKLQARMHQKILWGAFYQYGIMTLLHDVIQTSSQETTRLRLRLLGRWSGPFRKDPEKWRSRSGGKRY